MEELKSYRVFVPESYETYGFIIAASIQAENEETAINLACKEALSNSEKNLDWIDHLHFRNGTWDWWALPVKAEECSRSSVG